MNNWTPKCPKNEKTACVAKPGCVIVCRNTRNLLGSNVNSFSWTGPTRWKKLCKTIAKIAIPFKIVVSLKSKSFSIQDHFPECGRPAGRFIICDGEPGLRFAMDQDRNANSDFTLCNFAIRFDDGALCRQSPFQGRLRPPRKWPLNKQLEMPRAADVTEKQASVKIIWKCQVKVSLPWH
jgi:hypothetical protein